MDKINDIIDFYEAASTVLFIVSGFIFLWVVGKFQKVLKNRRKKSWKRKKIKW